MEHLGHFFWRILALWAFLCMFQVKKLSSESLRFTMIITVCISHVILRTCIIIRVARQADNSSIGRCVLALWYIICFESVRSILQFVEVALAVSRMGWVPRSRNNADHPVPREEKQSRWGWQLFTTASSLALKNRELPSFRSVIIFFP